MFYAFCGTNYEDAVAIDNIRSQTTTPEPTTPEPTTPEPTTPEPTTPEPTTPEPTTPEPTTPEPTTPEPTTPEPTTPEPTTPEPTTPEPTTPEPTTPEPAYCKDYSPCSCSVDSNKISVTCDGVSVQTVHDVFQRVDDPEIYELKWTNPLPDDETNTFSLPEDFLGNTSVTGKIYISSYDRLNLFIDPLAFRASQNSLTKFDFATCDFGLQKDLNFLNGFDKLEELTFSYIINLTVFQYLPPLPSLQKLKVDNCPEINQIEFPDLSPAKLNNLELQSNEINDETADKIVAKLAASTSADSLEVFDLWSNSLTRIPTQVESAFPQIKSVYLGGNSISYIPSSSLTFASPYLNALDLGSNELKTIESGAFVGINRLLSEQERIIIRVLLFL